MATKVEVESERDIEAQGFEVMGAIASVNTVNSTIVVRGVTVSYAGAVEFIGGTATNLQVGAKVEVRGTLASDGTTLNATQIRRALMQPRAVLEPAASAIGRPGDAARQGPSMVAHERGRAGPYAAFGSGLTPTTKPAGVVLSKRGRSSPRADIDLPLDHPLRSIKARAYEVLLAIEAVLKDVYARRERPTVRFEWVFCGQLLIALYGIASDRALCAELDANPSFRWFLNMWPGDTAPDWWEFARERRRLADSIIGRCVFHAVFAGARHDGSLYAREFVVDDDLVRSLASLDRVRWRQEDVVAGTS